MTRTRLLVSVFLLLALAPLFPQNIGSVDSAIDDFAKEFASQFPDGGNIAVAAFETDKEDLADHYIDTMIEKLLEHGKGVIEVYERQRIVNLQTEIDFSMSGYISDETAQEIGHLVGADTLIYGSLRNGSKDDEFRMTSTATHTETGRILFQKSYDVEIKPEAPNFFKEAGDEARLWTIGVSVGTSFARPWLIGTVHGTIAPFRFSFLEIGVDAGFISGDPEAVKYYSIYPFAHIAFFLPFNKGGWYIGPGVGCVLSEITYPDAVVSQKTITADFVTGFNIMNMFDISFSLRTDMKNVGTKFSVGYTYRFL